MITNTTLKEGFEGPEKRLEVEFECEPGVECVPGGLRSYTREQWQSLLNKTACTILSVTSNDVWDAYLLSESSLFVSENRIMLKTCGRTILLRGVDEIVKYGEQVGLTVRRVIYCRKNYTFPHRQLYPHRSFAEEVSFLSDRFPNGKSFVVGPQTTDHWLLYVAYVSETNINDDKYLLLELKMHEVDQQAMQYFSEAKESTTEASKAVTDASGIQSIIPAMVIDPWLFEPCGYSMNGVMDKSYSTIHITPESHCSYVSYEAFLSEDIASSDYVAALAERVLSVFRPASFTCTIITSEPLAPISELISSCITGYCSSSGSFEHIYSCSGRLGASLSIQTDMVAVLPSSSEIDAGQVSQSAKRLFVMSQLQQPIPPRCTFLPTIFPQLDQERSSSSELLQEPLPVVS